MPQTKRNIPISVGTYCTVCDGADCGDIFAHEDDSQDLKIFLDYHTKVIALGPAFQPDQNPEETFEISPYRRYHKRTHFVGEPSHYEFRNPVDLTYGGSGFYYTKPNPVAGTRSKRVYYKEGDPHPDAGKVAGLLPVKTLGSLSKGDGVMFRNAEGEWQSGVVGSFESYKSVRRQVARANSKQRERMRRLARRRTLWDVIEDSSNSLRRPV